MSVLQSLETSLNDIFVQKAPALPPKGKRTLVRYLPWINLVFGLLAVYTVYVLWHWAHLPNSFINYANSLSLAYGGPTIATNRLSVTIWLGIIVLVIEALLYLAAFPGLRDRKKSAWNLMFYVAIVNIVYGVVITFSSYGGVGNLIGSLIGSTIGLYLLFQIRGHYVSD